MDESRSRLKPSSPREDQSQCMTDQHGYDESLSLGPRHAIKKKVPMPDEQLNPLQILR